MRVNGLYIDATPEAIIAKLSQQLEDEGTFIFRRTKSLANNYQFSCPFHGGGTERHPSCGMSREVSYTGGRVHDAGTVHCFTCGYTNDLTGFISDVLGRKDGGFYGNQWLKRNFAASGGEVMRAGVDKNAFVRGAKAAEAHEPISEEELDKYRWFHPYMYKRKLTDELIEMFDIGYDKLNDCITFPVRDLEGRTIFFNRRSVNTKFHKYGENDPKTEYLYGQYELSVYADYFNEPISQVYVTESVINCLTLWAMKIPAVALMGVGGGNQINLLKKLPYRNIVLALDPDEAGQNAQRKIHRQLSRYKVVRFLDYPQEFFDNKWDINDFPEKLNFNKLVL